MKEKRLLLGAYFCFVLCVALIIMLLSGCASQNLTGTAKVHQQVTLSLGDACAIAVQAKAAYEAGTIPQTATDRSIINDAGAACEQAKIAFVEVLQAEKVYNNAAAVVQSTCVQPNSAACTEDTTKLNIAKVKRDQAQAAANNKLDVLATKATLAQSLIKNH